MPDHTHPTAAVPPDWHHAFAALPLESPPSDGWPRIAATLPRATRRRRSLLPWAVAAAIACLAALPAWHLLRTPAPAGSGVTAPTSAVHAPPQPRAASHAAAPTGTGDGDGSGAGTGAEPRAQAVAATAAPDSGLAPLQTESARLERLLAELSVADTGGGMQLALSASLRTRVAGIDDALAGTGLDRASRSDLWQERVELLRALTGLAADQRWQSLYGDNGADYALVQVH